MAYDSADVWSHPELFQMDNDGKPTAVAGCPPDGFSATGQLWGNPLYKWEYHKQTNYDLSLIHICAAQYYNNNPVIKEAVDFITGSELMSIGDKERLERLSNELIGKDWFMTFPDFDAYVKTREQAYTDYENRHDWAKKMLVNIAKAGYFSSDRTIEEYNRDIWKLEQ